MLSEIIMQINCMLTKLPQLKLGGPVIMPPRSVHRYNFAVDWRETTW